jgi:hypothetical protein
MTDTYMPRSVRLGGGDGGGGAGDGRRGRRGGGPGDFLAGLSDMVIDIFDRDRPP